MVGERGRDVHEDRPILILSASAGAGHVVAARAVESAFHALAPRVPVESHDVLAWASPLFRRIYSDGYMAIVRRAPALMGVLYERMDRRAGTPGDRLRRWIQKIGCRGIERETLARRPRLVVHTHFLSAEIVAGLRRRRLLACPQFTITTDFDVFRLWVQPPTERYFAATDAARDQLKSLGVEEPAITVSGVPIRAGFEPPLDRGDVRRRHALAPDRAVVLLLCGGYGGEAAEALLRALTALAGETQIVAVTGRERALRARLERAAEPVAHRVRVLGFTDRMHEWMQSSDLAVTKAGGLTTSEALACGLPLVLYRPIPGNETRNSDRLIEWGAAVRARTPGAAAGRVSELLGDGRRLARMRQAALAHARPAAAAAVVRAALDLLGESAAPAAEFATLGRRRVPVEVE